MINQTNKYQPLVTSGKDLNNKATKKVFIAVVVLGVFITATWLLFSKMDDSHAIEELKFPVAIMSNEAKDPSTLPKELTNAEPRTVYRLYHDPDTEQIYLFKATFLTKNQQPDVSAITIEKQDGKFIAYDLSTGKLIPNFKNIASNPLDASAVIVYSDNNYLLLKNKNDMGYQLEMIDPFSGELKWTISELELNGLDNLTTIYSEQDNLGIQLIKNEFHLTIPPNKVIISTQGRLIDFYNIN